ncbi:glycosyltransferase family 39 protein, partial [Patescibacteria group bacterium]|nr:glycosyltransferase family 39 protein [Patescibacteria group bacterium]
MKKYFWLIFGLFFVSRFFFLANYPHFYDSPEYLRESLSGNFFVSLSSSHEVIHPAWLFLTQIFQKITSWPTSWELSLISAIFGLLGFLAFYFLIKRNFNQKVALLSLIPLIFFPHLWLIQTNVLHESLDIGFFLLSLLFFDFFLERKKFSWWLLSALSLSLVIFDFVGILLWSPAFFSLVILRSKKIDWQNIIWSLETVLVSSVLAMIGLYWLLSSSHIIDPLLRLKTIFLVYGGGGIFSGWSLINILRMLRNDSLILFYGYSAAAILGLIISGFYLLKEKKWPLVIFLLSFFIPFIISGKFWYGGLFGRYSALVAYPLALILALIPWRKIYWF